MLNKWKEIKAEIRYAIYNSELIITEEIPYEGAQLDERKTDQEKAKLYNKIKEILKKYS